MIALATGVRVLLDDDTGGEAKKAGPLWAVVVIALCIACYFLFRSMSKHLRRVREHPFGAENPGGTLPAAAVDAPAPAGDADAAAAAGDDLAPPADAADHEVREKAPPS